MPYFFSLENLSLGKEVEIFGEEARHILLAHRAKKGERVKLQGPNKKRFQAEILNAGRGVVRLVAEKEIGLPNESSVETVLFQAMVSEKALDFIFQKGTELGLNKIVLFNSQNIAVKLTKEKYNSKKDRWEKILLEAAKQSERAVWPELGFAQDLESAVKQIECLEKVFLTDLSGERFGQKFADYQSVGIIVGPEGGLENKEVETIKNLPNCITVNLGPILLRAETAALSAISIIRNLS